MNEIDEYMIGTRGSSVVTGVDGESVPEKEESKFHGYLTVIGGISIHLFCGNLYLWGNISIYVMSYLNKLEGNKDATLKSAVGILPVSFIC